MIFRASLGETPLGAELDRGTLMRTPNITEGWDTGGVLVCLGCHINTIDWEA